MPSLQGSEGLCGTHQTPLFVLPSPVYSGATSRLQLHTEMPFPSQLSQSIEDSLVCLLQLLSYAQSISAE